MNLAGYALRPPRGPKDAMSTRQSSESGIVISSQLKKE
jgi:hypothetical protein